VSASAVSLEATIVVMGSPGIARGTAKLMVTSTRTVTA
jgi:hypothetical protein